MNFVSGLIVGIVLGWLGTLVVRDRRLARAVSALNEVRRQLGQTVVQRDALLNRNNDLEQQLETKQHRQKRTMWS